MLLWPGGLVAQTPDFESSTESHAERGAEEPARRFLVPERKAGDLMDGIPASPAVEDVFRLLLAEALRHPEEGPALVADFQQQVVDQAAGFAIDARTFHQLELARQRANDSLARPNPSGIPNLSVRELREARELPGLACTLKLQRKVLGELGELEIETLPVLTALYVGTFGLQVDRKTFWLSEHTQDLAIELAERYQRETGDHAMLAAFLVAVAERQLGAGSYSGGLWALELFERALEHRPEHVAARYWAGILAEKYGRYARAVRHFAALVEQAPDDVEARLRLAVNQLRTGERDQAEPALLALARGTPPAAGWMRRVAWSELVRVAGAEDRARAVALLREALVPFPEDPQLRLQLAFYERLSDWDETLRQLEHAQQLGRRIDEDGGRVVYELGREHELIANRAWLSEQVDERRGLTREAFERLALRWRNGTTKRKTIDACEELRPKGESR